MGERYKSCEIHGKPFPNNMVDSEKIEMVRLYVEKKEEIEGKNVTLTLFIGNKSENEGADACVMCLQEKILNLFADTGETPYWKNVSWHQETMQKKDGSGTYNRNVKTVKTSDEVALEIKEEKRKGA